MSKHCALGPLSDQDVGTLARLHRVAFPEFFLSELGCQFLVQFYRGFLRDPSAVTVVAKSPEGRLLGGVVGTTEPARFFRNLVRRQWPGFALASLRMVVVDPSAMPRLIRAVRYRGSPGVAPGALLSSVCVDPMVQGDGIGGQLVSEWTALAAQRGAVSAHLSTDAKHNDDVNRFYRNQGWQQSYCYRTCEGRSMNQYSKLLAV